MESANNISTSENINTMSPMSPSDSQENLKDNSIIMSEQTIEVT